MDVFEKIAGYDCIKEELLKIKQALAYGKEAGKAYKPRGILLYGEPGVGKTLFAESFIELLSLPCFSLKNYYSELTITEEIKKVFNEAKENSPSVIFIDDIDKMSNNTSAERDTKEFCAIQTCIDELKGSDVLVVATANDICKLPPSLLRFERFDKVIEIRSPNAEDAYLLIKSVFKEKQINFSEEELCESVAVLPEATCAKIKDIILSAHTEAVYSGRKLIFNDLIKAVIRERYPKASPINNLTDEERMKIAVHEAGHAVTAELINKNSVGIVSVLTKNNLSDALGITIHKNNRKTIKNKKCLEDEIKVLLGGKVAYELVYGETDSGAYGDIHDARILLLRILDVLTHNPMLIKKARCDCSENLNEEAEIILNYEYGRFYQETKELLFNKLDLIKTVAEELYNKTILNAIDLKNILKF